MHCILQGFVFTPNLPFEHIFGAVGQTGFLTLALMALGAFSVLMDRERTSSRVPEAGRTKERVVDLEAPKRAVIVGAGQLGQSLRDGLKKSGKFDVLGFIDDELPRDSDPNVHVLGATSSLIRVIQEHDVQEVIIAFTPNWHETIVEKVSASHPNVTIRIVPAYFEALMKLDSVESYGDIAVVKMVSGAERVDDLAKRALDLFLSVVILVLTLPLSLLAVLLIRVTSHGGAIFSQDRIGKGGNVFTVYKFRTMVANAEAHTGPVLADGANDARLTGIGKWLRLFRIDELPQLWNVVKGEMSIVGPRPERPEFVQEYIQANPMYALRHRARPGITGLAQVLGGYHTPWRDKLRFDLMYVSNQSIWLDISILLRTVQVVVFKRGHEKD